MRRQLDAIALSATRWEGVLPLALGPSRTGRPFGGAGSGPAAPEGECRWSRKVSQEISIKGRER